MNDIQFEILKKEHRGEDFNSPMQRRISCIGMINSVLAYHWTDKDKTPTEMLEWELKRYHSYLKQYVDLFGYTEVLRLITEQMKDIEEIKTNIHTDSQGVQYNFIVWKY